MQSIPAGQTLPVELYRPIVDHLEEKGTLLAISLTCRTLNQEAERRLYRKVVIHVTDDDRQSVKEVKMFENIVGRPGRLQHIHELRIMDQIGNFALLDRIMRAITTKPSPFQYMTRLRILQLWVMELIIPPVLESITPHVQLHHFHYSGLFGAPPTMKALSSFLGTQTELEQLSVTQSVALANGQLLTCQPPSLKTLVAWPRCLPFILPQPSIVRLFVTANVGRLYPAPIPSLLGLQVLRLEYFVVGHMSSFSSCFPTLQYLEVRVNALMGLDALLESMVSLRKLKLQSDDGWVWEDEELRSDWDGGEWDPVAGWVPPPSHFADGVAQLFASCPSSDLRAIEILPETSTTGQSRIWVRNKELVASELIASNEAEWRDCWPEVECRA